MATIDPGSVANTVNNVGSSGSGGTSSLPSLPTLTPQPVNLSLILHLDSVAIVASTAIVQALNGNFNTPRTPNAPGTPTPPPALPSGIDPRQIGDIAHTVGSVANSGSIGGGITQAVTGALSLIGPEGAAAAAIVGVLAMVADKIGEQGKNAVESVVRGAGSIVSEATRTGVKIGQTILEGALQPLGQSGRVVSDLIGKGIGSIGGSVSKAFEGVTGTIGSLFKFSTIATAITMPLAIPALLIRNIILKGIGDVLGGIGSVIGAVGDTALEAFKGALSVLDDILGSVTKLAGAAATLSQNSGMSLAQASTANNLLAGFGIKGTDVEGLSRNTFIQGTVSRAFGIQGAVGSAEYIGSFRDRYREMAFNPDGSSNPIGLLQAQARAKGAGLEALIPLASMPDAVYNRQQQHSQQLQSSLGMTPAQIEKANYDWMSLTATVSQAAELIKSKFAADLMPTLTRELDKGISWISSHSGDISKGLQRAATWLTDDLPKLLVKTARSGMNAFDALYLRVARFAFGIGETIGTIQTSRTMDGIVRFAGMIDTVSGALDRTMHTVGDALISFGNSLVDLANLAVGGVNTIADGIKEVAKIPYVSKIPIIGSAITALSSVHLDSIAKTDPTKFDKFSLATHLKDAAVGFRDETLGGIRDRAYGYSKDILASGDSADKTGRGWIDSFEDFMKVDSKLERIASATEATAKHTGTLADRADTPTAEFMTREAALLVRGWYRKQSLA